MGVEANREITRSTIDPETCQGCGLCVAVCPAWIPQQAGRAVTELRADRLYACIQCGHCMAVCPTGSVHIAGLSYQEDLFDLPPGGLDGDAFLALLASRRSVRVFKNTPVPRDLLQRILDAVALAPMSAPPHKIKVIVVQSRETIEQALPLMVELYENLGQWMRNPLIRFMIRRRAGRSAFDSLRDHVLPSMRYRLPDMRAGKGDAITRGAPALLLFHAHREALGHEEDALIALTHGLLAAHALGLGATAIGLIPPAVERSPALRELFQVPPEDKVLASMILGYPKHRFKRGIRRELTGVQWI